VAVAAEDTQKNNSHDHPVTRVAAPTEDTAAIVATTHEEDIEAIEIEIETMIAVIGTETAREAKEANEVREVSTAAADEEDIEGTTTEAARGVVFAVAEAVVSVVVEVQIEEEDGTEELDIVAGLLPVVVVVGLRLQLALQGTFLSTHRPVLLVGVTNMEVVRTMFPLGMVLVDHHLDLSPLLVRDQKFLNNSADMMIEEGTMIEGVGIGIAAIVGGSGVIGMEMTDGVVIAMRMVGDDMTTIAVRNAEGIKSKCGKVQGMEELQLEIQVSSSGK
jgi:hypothetical protein